MGLERPATGIALAAIVLLAAALPGCFQQIVGPRIGPTDYLRESTYTSLLIEIDYVASAKPADSAVALLKQRAEERLNKPGGVTSQMTSFTGGRSVWTISDLQAAEDAHRDMHASGSRLVLYVLYVDGGSWKDSDDARVLGVQYGPTSLAIFKDNIRSGSFSGLSFGQTEVERAVLVHEFGHAIGLVNNGVPMVKDHEGEGDEGEKHSANRNSVMYYAIETSDIFAFLTPPPTQFDADDIRDLQAAGGK